MRTTISSAFVAALAFTPAIGAGPDVITHDMPSFVAYAPADGERAYAVNGVWCNLGDATAVWNPSTPSHPVTGTNLFRIEDGVLEHLGASWAHHHICALEQAACMTCTPSGAGCVSQLGIGCSTTSTASFVGQQATLGPRSQVNAATGVPAFPFSAPPATGSLARRCRALLSDVDPAAHATALFAFETVTLHPSNGIANNRCVTRPISANSLFASGAFSGPANEATTAVDWWKSHHPDVTIATIDQASDGRVLIAARVIAIGRGQWKYVYAIENLDSHDSIRGISMPLNGASATLPSFRFPPVHSGEITSNEPWTITIAPASVEWSGQGFDSDPNANAVRWGTTYTVSVITDRPPMTRAVTLTRFHSNTTFTVALPAPTGPDLDDDGLVNASDLALLLGAWGRCDPARSDCSADIDGDGQIDASDLSVLLGAWTR